MMSPKAYDVAIAGGGLSGIVAANMLADHHLDILLIDENQAPGGQFMRTHPPLGPDRHPLKRLGSFYLQELKKKNLEVISRAQVLDITPDKEVLLEENGERLLTFKPGIVLLASGAREKFIPFKGWTLPGVISTGAAQILMKASKVLPAEKILIAGSGPFIYTVAAEILANSGRVPAILDQSSLPEKLSFVRGLLPQGSKLAEGLGNLARILLSRTPVKHRTGILQAGGDGSLKEVVTVKLNRAGAPLAGTEKAYQCECLAVGNGFAANVEIGQLTGCRLEYKTDHGGWFIAVNHELETTVPDVFAAGEITGIAGAAKSMTEGKLAALSILHRLGKIGAGEFSARCKPLTKERARHLRFIRHLNALNATPVSLIRALPDETIVCRCEDITLGRIREAIKGGCHTPAALKRAVRTGMGICQGRICGPMLYEILAAYANTPAEKMEPLSARGPVKALPLGLLAKPIERLLPRDTA